VHSAAQLVGTAIVVVVVVVVVVVIVVIADLQAPGCRIRKHSASSVSAACCPGGAGAGSMRGRPGGRTSVGSNATTVRDQQGRELRDSQAGPDGHE
jgi:hypothetical protein